MGMNWDEDDDIVSVFREFLGALLGMIQGQGYYKCQVGGHSRVWQFLERMSVYERLFLSVGMNIWISVRAEYYLEILC